MGNTEKEEQKDVVTSWTPLLLLQVMGVQLPAPTQGFTTVWNSGPRGLMPSFDLFGTRPACGTQTYMQARLSCTYNKNKWIIKWSLNKEKGILEILRWRKASDGKQELVERKSGPVTNVADMAAAVYKLLCLNHRNSF